MLFQIVGADSQVLESRDELIVPLDGLDGVFLQELERRAKLLRTTPTTPATFASVLNCSIGTPAFSARSDSSASASPTSIVISLTASARCFSTSMAVFPTSTTARIAAAYGPPASAPPSAMLPFRPCADALAPFCEEVSPSSERLAWSVDPAAPSVGPRREERDSPRSLDACTASLIGLTVDSAACAICANATLACARPH